MYFFVCLFLVTILLTVKAILCSVKLHVNLHVVNTLKIIFVLLNYKLFLSE